MRRGGWAARSRFVVVAVLENDLGRRRLGVTVSSKVGKAVVRSRVKRWLREAYRRSREELPSGVDVVLIARPGSGEAGFDRIVAELEDLAKVLRSQADRPGHRRDRPGRIRDGT